MAYGSAIRQGLRIAGRIDRKYNINKIFVEKYVPPGYRQTVRRIFDITGTLGGGYGLYNAYQSLIAPDTPGNRAFPPFQPQTKTGTPYQTRGRQSRRYNTRCSPRQKSRFYGRRSRSY